MNAPRAIRLALPALLVAAAGGLTAAAACPQAPTPPAPPSAPALQTATPTLLRVAAPPAPAPIVQAVYTPAPAAQAGQALASWSDDDAPGSVVIVTDDNGEKYEVRVEGRRARVKHNGEKLDQDRVRVTEDKVIVLDEHGKTVRSFDIGARGNRVYVFGEGGSPAWAGAAAPPARAGQLRAEPAPPLRAEPARVGWAAPPVMVGIHQTDVPAAVRWQLGLGDRPALLVERVVDGLPAAEAGIHQYDVIVSIDGSDHATGSVLAETLRSRKPGDQVSMVVISKGEKKTVKIELAKYDAKALGARAVGIAEPAFPGEDAQAWSFEVAPDADFEFEFDEGFAPRMQEEIRRQYESVLRELEHHGDHGQHEEARRRLEEMAAKIDAQVADKLRQAEQKARQARDRAIELRGNRLVLPERFSGNWNQAQGDLESRLGELEGRLDELNSVLEDRLSGMMDRLSEMMDQLHEELEERLDDEE